MIWRTLRKNRWCFEGFGVLKKIGVFEGFGALKKILKGVQEFRPNRTMVEDIPKQFPFEIEDNPVERTRLPHLSTGYEDDDNAEEEEEERADDLSIPLVVSISKGNGVELVFGVTALPDEVTIDSLSIKQPEAYEGRLAYEGPKFSDLDENLQKAFHNYVEVPGIEPRTANFLHQFMAAKNSNEYINWFKNLENFVEH